MPDWNTENPEDWEIEEPSFWEPNPFALLKQRFMDTLEPTWWALDREPGMDDLAEQAGDSLKQMGEDLKIYPFQDKDKNDRLFLARFELPKYQADFQFPDAVFAEDKTTVAGFIDFLGGFPWTT